MSIFNKLLSDFLFLFAIYAFKNKKTAQSERF
mgnify:CR=1 FL=1